MRRTLLILSVLLVGCQSGQIPDPNDARRSEMSAKVLRDNLRAMSQSLLQRRMRQEITTEEYKNLVAKAAGELVDEMDMESVSDEEAWEVAEVLRAARNWDAAGAFLVRAVSHAKKTGNEDRRINDTLRLAQVRAAQGSVDEAIALAEETLNAAPEESAPILPGVFYEVLRDARGKGKDYELAQLVEKAVDKHLLTVVDPNSQPGRDFELARTHHVVQALASAGDLFESTGHASDATRVRARARLAQDDIAELIRSARERAGKAPTSGAQPEDQRHL